MKLILLSVVLSASTNCFSQFYLGYPVAQVKKMAVKSGTNIKLESSYEDGNLFIGWYDNYVRETVCFKKGISWLFTLAPTSDGALKGLIKQFNERYIKISDEHWKAYLNGKVYNIVLTYLDESSSYVFGISQAK